MAERIVSTKQMYAYDKAATDYFGIPEMVLMERAALSVYEGIVSYLNDNHIDTKKTPILVVCSTGNNGGDGLAIARLLYLKGYDVEVLYIGDEAKASESNELQKNIFYKYCNQNVGVCDVSNTLDSFIYKTTINGAKGGFNKVLKKHGDFSVIVDSLYGIGINRELSADIDDLFLEINDYKCLKVAVDIPSGISADGAVFAKNPFKADVTYTFGYKKTAHVLYPTREYCGDVRVADIGISVAPTIGYDKYFDANENVIWRIDKPYDYSLFERPDNSNKATFGKLLIIAGSKEVFGAPILSTLSSFGCGVGMVIVITHENNVSYFADKCPEAMIRTYNDEILDSELLSLFETCEKWADGILIGPGIGINCISKSLVENCINKSKKPIVFDADGLNVLAQYLKKDEEFSFPSDREVILTPHIKEFERLSGVSVNEIKSNPINEANDFAGKLKCTVILKDAVSIIALGTDKCKTIYVSDLGNNGMATAGSGDVLAGICATLLIQNRKSRIAAHDAVYIHGLAGGLAMKEKGVRGMVAGDIIIHLKEVFDNIDKEYMRVRSNG